MSRSSLSPVTIALDPGFASWMLRQRLRRVAADLGTPAIDPVLPITRPFAVEDGCSLAAVRAGLEAALPREPYFAYTLDGYGSRRSSVGGTVGVRIRPSDRLAATAGAIEGALIGLATPVKGFDERFLLPVIRATHRQAFLEAVRLLDPARLPWHLRLIARHRSPARAEYAPGLLRPLDACRLLLLVGDRPAAGFDLGTRRWLGRAVLQDRDLLGQTYRDYRRARGIELTAPRFAGRSETWFGADLHLGHPEIALYGARPFLGNDGGEMDRVLIDNWNRSVAPDGRALLLGDLCASSDPDTYREAASRLNGRLVLVRGNHDPDLPELVDSFAFDSGGHRFLAVHDPADVPGTFDGWVVHGHAHDSDLRRYPFFDPVRRRINVSVETAGYGPVPLSLISGLVRKETDTLFLRSPILPAESNLLP
jgi:calcineurin-like phosphoesterase family protein